jgi:ABC-type lipoprotein release transport system permease subunit
VGAASAGFFWKRPTWRTTMKMTKAMIRKLITVFKNCPYAITGAAAVLAAAAILASLVPALRASRVDVLQALRSE